MISLFPLPPLNDSNPNGASELARSLLESSVHIWRYPWSKQHNPGKNQLRELIKEILGGKRLNEQNLQDLGLILF